MEKQLPKNWTETELGNYVTLKNGYAFKSSDFKNEGLPIIRISNIQDGKIELDNSVCVDDHRIKPDFIVAKGDILIAMSGATTGKFGVFDQDVIALQNQRVGNLKPINEEFSNKQFIYYLLGGLKKEIEDKAYGGAQPNISPKLIESIIINLPPLEEQKRIAVKLDTLFTQLENIKTSMSNIPVLLKNFRQQVLTQAVTGKLTEEWRKGKKLSEWEDLKIGEIIASIQSGKSFLCPEVPVNKGQVGLVKISAVTWEVFDQTKTKTVTDKSKIIPEYFIKKGDFLMSRANTIELVGASVIVDEIEYDIMLSDKVWRVNFKNDNDKTFMNYFLKSKQGRLEIESKATGNQESMRNLSQNNFKNINIKLPQLIEQQEIVTRVESLFAKADAIEQQYKSLKEKIDTLPQALLHKAFKGELTEQLDSDGDARELLKQIQKLKNSAVKPKKATTKKVKNYAENEEVLGMVAEIK